MSAVGRILSDLLFLFLLLLLFRLVMEWVFVLARSYRPAGAMAAVLEIVYSITDPPLRALRKIIPPLRLGSSGIALDLAFIVLILLVGLARQLVLLI